MEDDQVDRLAGPADDLAVVADQGQLHARGTQVGCEHLGRYSVHAAILADAGLAPRSDALDESERPVETLERVVDSYEHVELLL